MDTAKTFVNDEYTIRPIKQEDIDKWENDFEYNKEGYAFAEKIIEKFRTYYIL